MFEGTIDVADRLGRISDHPVVWVTQPDGSQVRAAFPYLGTCCFSFEIARVAIASIGQSRRTRQRSRSHLTAFTTRFASRKRRLEPSSGITSRNFTFSTQAFEQPE